MSKQSFKSFRYKENNVGLRMHPCLTPILVSKLGLKPCSVFTEYNNDENEDENGANCFFFFFFFCHC